MITHGGITLYHACVDSDTRAEMFNRYYFPACSIFSTVSVEKRHSRNGPWRERETIIRIPISDMLKISVGDRVVTGECTLEIPPEDSLQVCGFADNRRGGRAVSHYKIVCR